jgi:predicted DNA-binding protein
VRPGAAYRAEHVAAENPGTDVGKGLLAEIAVNALLPTALAMGLLKSFGTKKPIVHLEAAHSEGCGKVWCTLRTMEVRFRPETESRLNELATKSGRAPSDLVEDAMAAYLQEVAEVCEMLDSRYDDLKSGRVKPVDGENAFAELRRKSNERRSRS